MCCSLGRHWIEFALSGSGIDVALNRPVDPLAAIRTLSQIQELVMKALITAFALFSFVAASTIPVVARADAQTQQTTPKKTMHSKKKQATKKTSGKKKTAAKKTPPKKKTPAA
jgi:hypothetical protein